MTSLFDRPIRRRWLAALLLPIWRLADWLLAKDSHCWAFSEHPFKPGQFVENSRAVFEAIKSDPTIRKRVFTRNGSKLDLQGSVNTEVVELQSLAGLLALSRCGVIFLTHAIGMDLSWRWPCNGFSVVKPSLTRRLVINLWHGVPLKRLYATANYEQRSRADRVPFRRRERAYYAGLIASSDVDSYAMAAIFQPLAYDSIWVTGLPRSDFLAMEFDALPSFLGEAERRIGAMTRGRRLVVYAPTFREHDFNGAACYRFSDAEIDALKALLARHDAALGFRMHYFRKGDALFNMEDFLDGDRLIDLGHTAFPEMAPVLRAADLLVTDYSSVFIDALYIDKPVFSFAYDLDNYRNQQNGLLYDMELVFPGPVVRDMPSLLEALDAELRSPAQVGSERYRLCRQFFFKYRDAANARRVLAEVTRRLPENRRVASNAQQDHP